MFLSDLKNDDIVAFIGKDGVAILSKALEKVFAESHGSATDLVKSLHLKTRCLMAWVENVSKHGSFAQIPLTKSVTDISFKDVVLSFEDGNTAVIRNRDVNLHSKERSYSVIETIENATLPVIASRVMNLEQYQDELNENEFVNSASLNKTVKELVDSHLDFLRKSATLQLSKSEAEAVCPDCQQRISISSTSAKLCVCYKFFKNASLHVEKNDKNGLTVHFGKQWDKENIALFSKALKSKLK